MRMIHPVHAGALLGAVTLAVALATAGAGSSDATTAAGLASGMPHGAAEVVASRMDALWKAVAASGTVESALARDNGPAWIRVRRGDLLRPLTEVRTAKRSRTTLARLGDVILVDPETRLTLPAGQVESGRTIEQSSGSALYEIETGSAGRAVVVTPYLVAGVKGTVFSVIVDRAYSSVSVIRGNVEVLCRPTGEVVELFEGDTVVYDGESKALELYRTIREEARDAEVDVSRNARRSLDTTERLLDEASSDLDDGFDESLGWDELRSLDLSMWKGDREVLKEDLSDSLKEDREILTDEDLLKGIRGALKTP